MSKVRLVKDMKNAKKALMLCIQIGEINYSFVADIFDLDSCSIPALSDQIAKIPGHIAFVHEAHGQAERVLSKLKTSLEIWWAKELSVFDDSDSRKSEQKMKNMVLKDKKKCAEYEKKDSEVVSMRQLVGVLEGYRRGMEAKLQLAQTLSANIRTERESYRRNYDKKNPQLGSQLGS